MRNSPATSAKKSLETCCDIVLFMSADRIDFSRPKKRETAPSAVPIAKLKAIGAFFVCTVHVPFIIPGRQTRLMRTRWLHYSAPSSCSASAQPPSPLVGRKPTHAGNQMQINSINTLFPPLLFLQPRRFWYRQGETTCPRSYTGNNSLRRLLLLLLRTR